MQVVALLLLNVPPNFHLLNGPYNPTGVPRTNNKFKPACSGATRLPRDSAVIDSLVKIGKFCHSSDKFQKWGGSSRIYFSSVSSSSCFNIRSGRIWLLCVNGSNRLIKFSVDKKNWINVEVFFIRSNFLHDFSVYL